MCLYIKSRTGVPKRKFAYKIVWVDNGKKRPPSEKQCYKIYKYRQWFVSDRTTKEITGDENSGRWIERGVHVYQTKRAAERSFLFNNCQNMLIIQVEVSPNDWVADGMYNDAVYMKVKPIKRIKSSKY